MSKLKNWNLCAFGALWYRRVDLHSGIANGFPRKLVDVPHPNSYSIGWHACLGIAFGVTSQIFREKSLCFFRDLDFSPRRVKGHLAPQFPILFRVTKRYKKSLRFSMFTIPSQTCCCPSDVAYTCTPPKKKTAANSITHTHYNTPSLSMSQSKAR